MGIRHVHKNGATIIFRYNAITRRVHLIGYILMQKKYALRPRPGTNFVLKSCFEKGCGVYVKKVFSWISFGAYFEFRDAVR